MKKIKVFLFLITSMCLLYSCSEPFNAIDEEELVIPELKKVQNNSRCTGRYQDCFVTMKSTGLNEYYRIIGKGPFNVVLIPGWTNLIEVFTKQFDYFKDVARCIYIDLPGHGLSDPLGSGDYSMNLMADAIYTVVKKEGLHKFTAVGFNLGPLVLGQFERQYPGMITKLVSIDGGFSPWPKSGAEREQFIAKREGAFIFFSQMNDIAKLGLLQNLIPPATSPPDLIEFGNYFMDFPNERLANIVMLCFLFFYAFLTGAEEVQIEIYYKY